MTESQDMDFKEKEKKKLKTQKKCIQEASKSAVVCPFDHCVELSESRDSAQIIPAHLTRNPQQGGGTGFYTGNPSIAFAIS